MLIAFIIFKEAFIKGEPLRPGDDSYFLDYPFRLLAWNSITNGEWPLWNPYNSGGMNLLGQPFFFIIYPLYDLIYLVSESKIFYVLSLIQILHIILALIGMFFLLKKIVKDPLICFWGSIFYGFSYPVITGFYIGQLLVSYAYLPWIILVILTFKNRNIYKNILLLSLLLFLVVGGGFPQWSIFTLFIIFLFIIFRYNPFNQKLRQNFLLGIGIFIMSLIIAFLLGSIEFIPFIEQNLYGARGSLDFNTIINTQQKWITPWFLSFRLFVPDLFSENLRIFISNPMIFLEDNFNSYFGIAAALLALISIFYFHKKWLINWKLIAAIVFAGALGLPVITNVISFLMMNSDFVYTRIGSFLPFVGIILTAALLKVMLYSYRKMNTVLKIFFIFFLILILIFLIFSFFGKKLFGENLNIPFIQKQIIIGIIFISLYLVIFFSFKKKFIGRNTLLVLICILAVLEINFTSLEKVKQYLQVRPVQEYLEETKGEELLVSLLGEEKYNYRIHNTSVRFGGITHYTGGPYMHYFPNANVFNKFYEANGYILNMPDDVGQLLTNRKGGYFIRMADVLIYNSLPNLLSIKYIIAPKNFEPYENRLDLSKKYKVINEFTDGPSEDKYYFKIIEIIDVPPRFFFTSKVEDNKDRELVFDLIIKPSFDPREITYFEDSLSESVRTKTFNVKNQIIKEVMVPSANQVIVKVSAETPGILVANNFYHKWWKVKVNNIPQKLYRANYNFQAVEVPSGDSVLFFYCEAESLKLGSYLSFIGLICIAFLTIMSLSKKHVLANNTKRVKIKEK